MLRHAGKRETLCHAGKRAAPCLATLVPHRAPRRLRGRLAPDTGGLAPEGRAYRWKRLPAASPLAIHRIVSLSAPGIRALDWGNTPRLGGKLERLHPRPRGRLRGRRL